jgi:C-terminal processing protease CtpA/Prc
VRELIGGALNAYETARDIGEYQGSKYTGRTVALIDERTRGFGEEAALAFEGVAGTQFVGSPSTGASGAVSHLVAPGNIPIRFTGVEVLHADGRQLASAGIEPQVRVQPTIRGLAQGHDEVLEAAIALINQ